MQTILDNPDEDTPRLVFADWLDEQGETERAEFIRCQIWLHQTKGQDNPQRELWLNKEKALLKQHGNRWKEELPDIPGVSWGNFTRGFITAATLYNAADSIWRRYVPSQYIPPQWDKIYQVAPINTVHFKQFARESLHDFLSHDGTTKIRSLTIGSTIRDSLPVHFQYQNPIEVLTNCSRLIQLCELECGQLLQVETELTLLCLWPQLQSIHNLCLVNQEITDAFIFILVQSPYIHSSLYLELSGRWNLSEEGLRRFREKFPDHAFSD